MNRNLLDALSFGSKLLSEYATEQARHDAQILLCHLLKIERIDIYLNHDKPMTSNEFSEYVRLLKLRNQGTPIQYLTGWVDFLSHRFLIEEGVFIPRRDTETLVEEVFGQLTKRENITVLDIATGCGNIGISLALGLPSARVYATDISSKAISLATENARHLGVNKRVKFLKADLFAPPSFIDLPVDIIVSNPPYVRNEDMKNLPAEVKAEPAITCNGGKDGLEFIRRVVGEGKEYLSGDGMMAIEFGWDQAESVRKLMEENGYERIKITRDLGGNERVVTAYRG